MKKKQRVLSPYTETAMRRAMARYCKGGCLAFEFALKETDIEINVRDEDGILIAVFSLRMCFEKRAPLKGIGKAVSALTRKRPKAKR